MALLLTSLLGTLAAAQAPDAKPVLQAAAEAIRSRITGGSIALDPQVLDDSTAHSADAVTALQGVLGGPVAKRADIVRCDGHGPSSCRLRNSVAVVAFGAPSVRGDSATVLVVSAYATGLARIPVAHETLCITVARNGSQWRTTNIQVLQRS